MNEAGNAAVGRLGEPTKPTTEGEQILKQLSGCVLMAQELEGRFHAALNRLNYDEPQPQDQRVGAAGTETSPPFSSQVDRQLMAMRTTLDDLARGISRLERFV